MRRKTRPFPSTCALAAKLRVFALACACVVFPALASPVPASAAPLWLDRLNAWRGASGVSTLLEDPTWSQGDYNHSLYMVKNDAVTHYEVSGMPYYTPEGDTAARHGNIQVSSTTSKTDDSAIDWWMAAPFHQLGMMDPRLSSTGFGAYRQVKSGWQAGFTLDTLRGNSFSGGNYPVFFPGNGSSVPLSSYGGGEFPDPLQGCPGYSAPTGLPVTIQVGGNVATTITAHSFTGNGLALAHCVIDSTNGAVGSNLVSREAAILIPQQPLLVGVQYVVSLTVNGAAYQWSFTISGNNAIVPANVLPKGWAKIGGVVTSGVGAAAWSATRTDVFVRGTEGGLWDATWDGTGWSWTFLGGLINAEPAAVSWGPNRIDVFVRGVDNALWHRAFAAGTWYPWEKLGGMLTAGPGVASWAPGRLDVFVSGSERGLWQVTWDGVSWSWSYVGGVITSAPGAVSWGPNRIDVFARGLEGGMWQAAWNGSAWIWRFLDGRFVTGPQAASCTLAHLDVFGIGLDQNLWRLGYNGSAWGGWQPMGGQWGTRPGSVCTPGTGSVQLFERAPDLSVAQMSTPGS